MGVEVIYKSISIGNGVLAIYYVVVVVEVAIKISHEHYLKLLFNGFFKKAHQFSLNRDNIFFFRFVSG